MAIRADRVGVRQDQVDIHGRVTSPSFLNELLDDLPEWTDMPVWVNGTEELLPSNNSVPVTSPILADIAYPDIRRGNQYFTYRESPTPVDGLAKIKSIKGNTLRWNQLVQNGNFADTSIWSVTGTGSSFTVSNNIATITASGAYDRIQQSIKFINGHKYLIKVDVKKTNADDDIRLYYGTHLGAGSYTFANTTEWQTKSIIKTAIENTTTIYPNVEGTTSNLTWQQRNMMIFDLTQMGLDITASDFTSLFSLLYYDYSQGSLLSFNGNGIKTVGLNRADISNAFQGSWTDAEDTSVSNIRVSLPSIKVFGSSIYIKSEFDFWVRGMSASNTLLYTSASWLTTRNITLPSGVDHVLITFRRNANNDNLLVADFITENNELMVSESEADYEPYTSSTTSLPISTYFPTGMKSAGNAYDELTPRKATTRLKATTFTSVSAFDSSGKLGTLGDATDVVNITSDNVVPNDKSVFETYSLTGLRNNDVNGITQFGTSFYVRLQGKTTLEEYNTYLSANPLVVIYELATPVELPTMSFE